MKAILIARVSTEEQREAGNSLPAQVVRLEQYCQRRGFEILEVCNFNERAYCNNRTKLDAIIDLILDQKEKAFYRKCFLVKIRPGPDLRYCLNLIALSRSLNETDVTNFHGLC